MYICPPSNHFVGRAVAQSLSHHHLLLQWTGLDTRTNHVGFVMDTGADIRLLGFTIIPVPQTALHSLIILSSTRDSLDTDSVIK
jgi:hypothetical protein